MMFVLPAGYDHIHFDNQTVYNPVFGTGLVLGELDLPFNEIDRRFMIFAQYKPIIFAEKQGAGMPDYVHHIEGLFDGRINRHQLLAFFKTISDKPVVGGLNTFQTGAGWAYEVIRQSNMSLILGGILIVNDFGIDLPSGDPLPILPIPIVRFGFRSQWFNTSFDFFGMPTLNFTIAPKEKIRFTANAGMEFYRSIQDLLCTFTLWYRLFDENHSLGDFAGIGIGFKNNYYSVSLSRDAEKKLELNPTNCNLHLFTRLSILLS